MDILPPLHDWNAMTIDAMDKWNAVAEQYYARRYGREANVWAALISDAWVGVSEGIYEEHELEELGRTPEHSVTISWSGPMFNTMDGGDYHYGTETFYSDNVHRLVDYVCACLVSYKKDGYQSAEAMYGDSDVEIEMKDIIVPWEATR